MTANAVRPRIRELRLELGWTQAELAERLAGLAWMHRREHVGVNADMVAKWERGAKGISPRYRELLCLLFGVTAEQLGLTPGRPTPAPEPSTPDTDDDSLVSLLDNAASVLDQLGAPGSALAPQMLDVWKDSTTTRRTMFALLDPAATDPAGHARAATATVADLGALADRYRDLYPTAAPAPLLTAVAAHVRMVGEVLGRDPSPANRSRLLTNRARVAILAGRLAAEDLDNTLSGHAYYSLAADSSREADHGPLAAIALGYAAHLAAAEGCPVAALDRLTEAARHTERSPAVRAWLATLAATIHADRDEHQDAAEELDHARALVDQADPGGTMAWFEPNGAGRLTAVAAHLALRARDHTRARDGFVEALGQVPPTARRQRVLCLIGQATAELHAGDHPEACLHATQAAELLGRASYATGTARLQAFRDLAARPLGRRALRILDTHLNHPAA